MYEYEYSMYGCMVVWLYVWLYTIHRWIGA